MPNVLVINHQLRRVKEKRSTRPCHQTLYQACRFPRNHQSWGDPLSLIISSFVHVYANAQPIAKAPIASPSPAWSCNAPKLSTKASKLIIPYKVFYRHAQVSFTISICTVTCESPSLRLMPTPTKRLLAHTTTPITVSSLQILTDQVTLQAPYQIKENR